MVSVSAPAARQQVGVVVPVLADSKAHPYTLQPKLSDFWGFTKIGEIDPQIGGSPCNKDLRKGTPNFGAPYFYPEVSVDLAFVLTQPIHAFRPHPSTTTNLEPFHPEP